MRKIIIETIEPGETEIDTFVSELNAKEITLLLDLGMNINELLLKDHTEFLTKGGAQYKVTLCMPNAFIQAVEGNA